MVWVVHNMARVVPSMVQVVPPPTSLVQDTTLITVYMEDAGLCLKLLHSDSILVCCTIVDGELHSNGFTNEESTFAHCKDSLHFLVQIVPRGINLIACQGAGHLTTATAL